MVRIIQGSSLEGLDRLGRRVLRPTLLDPWLVRELVIYLCFARAFTVPPENFHKMATTDSVSVFAEGTFEEQVLIILNIAKRVSSQALPDRYRNW